MMLILNPNRQLYKILVKIILSASLILCVSNVFAKTVYEAKNGDTISATVSANDLTRIEISGQRIIKSFGSANISKKITKPLGQIYLVPNQNTTFNLYIVSDTGNTYNLKLTPSKNATGDSIIIRPSDAAKVTNRQGVKFNASGYIRNLNYLMQIMYLNRNDSSEYAVTDVNQAIVTYQGLDSVLLRKYTSDSLTGYVLLIKNTNKTKVLLNESDFYASHTLAVAIENPEVLVNDFTRVFIIKEGE